MEILKPSQLLVEKYLRGQGKDDSSTLSKTQLDLSESDRLQVLTKIQKLCEDDCLFDHFQQLLQKDDHTNFQQSQKTASFPKDFATEELFSVYGRLYSLAKDKAKQGQVKLPQLKSDSLKQKQVCDRLYKESKDRVIRNKAKQLAYETKIQAQRLVQPLSKSNRLAYEKVARDIERVMEWVDYGTTGYFNARQVGQCLQLLKVFSQMFIEEGNNKVNKILQEREEIFLMNLWYTLNPIEQTTIEAKILYTFLKLVFDPYHDGTQQSFQELTSETSRLVDDIKKFQLELVPDAVHDCTKVQITVEQLLQEMFELSNNFSGYKRGLVVLPNLKDRKQYQKLVDDFTFKPKINPLSAKIDQVSLLRQSMNLAGKIVRRDQNGSFLYNTSTMTPKSSETTFDLQRIEMLYVKEQRKNAKLEIEREKKQERELDGCTFKPTLLTRQASGDGSSISDWDIKEKVTNVKQKQRKTQQKPSWELKEELEFQKCTFRPSTAKPTPKSKLPLDSKPVSGYTQTVERMRLAEEERERKNQILNGQAKKYTGKITQMQPFSFEKSRAVENKKLDVILDVEITVPPNRVANLKIRKGDSVNQTITVFAKLWGLNQLTETAIHEKITQHLIANQLHKFTTEGEQELQHSEQNESGEGSIARQLFSQPSSQNYFSCQDANEIEIQE